MSLSGHTYFWFDGEDRIKSVANLEFLHYSAEPRTGVSLGGASSTAVKSSGRAGSIPIASNFSSQFID